MTQKKKAASSDGSANPSKKNNLAKPTTKRGYLERIHGHVAKEKGGNR